MLIIKNDKVSSFDPIEWVDSLLMKCMRIVLKKSD